MTWPCSVPESSWVVDVSVLAPCICIYLDTYQYHLLLISMIVLLFMLAQPSNIVYSSSTGVHHKYNIVSIIDLSNHIGITVQPLV